MSAKALEMSDFETKVIDRLDVLSGKLADLITAVAVQTSNQEKIEKAVEDLYSKYHAQESRQHAIELKLSSISGTNKNDLKWVQRIGWMVVTAVGGIATAAATILAYIKVKGP